MRIGELFPQIAKLADRFAILRSLHTGSNDHGVAGTIGLTGSVGRRRRTRTANRGRLGPAGDRAASWPRRAAASSKLPPFMVVGGKLHQGKKAIIGEGGGTARRPVRSVPPRIRSRSTGTRIPALQLPADLTPERLGDRQQLAAARSMRLQRHGDALHAAGALDDYRAPGIRHADLAGGAADVRPVAASRTRSSDRYGRTRFGQSCLLARRLVEHGVPFVQVNWSDHVEAEEDAGDGGWDHHYRNFQIMQDRHAPWLDQALSALLDDLHERGLLRATLVVAVGEFGRSPKINDKAGRDHWEHCYSALFAGGGVHGGRVIGASDAPRRTSARSARHARRPRRHRPARRRHHQRAGRRRSDLPVDGKVIEELL